MPLVGTTNRLHWPPFAASPLDGRLWDYVERGQIVDIAPLLAHSGGRAFWVFRNVTAGRGTLRQSRLRAEVATPTPGRPPRRRR